MLDAADILIDRHPIVRLRRVEGQLGIVRVGIAHVIPARAREGIHRVSLTLGRSTTLRTGGVDERFVRCQRLARRQVDVFGQQHRQLIFRHRHYAAMLAMNGRDRVAPITLARDEPVAQAEFHAAFAFACALKLGNDRFFGW